jgi:hypothetical protein
MPTAAVADGGAYIEFDRTHYLPGSTATGEAYVSVPEPKQHLFEEGPFYVWVLPPRAWIEPGRPIPSAAIRAGTVTVEHTGGREFELAMSFVVPDVPGDYYNIGVCNDPCTIAGFQEPLTAQVSIIATAREGELLNNNSRLLSRTWTLRRQVRKAERGNEQLEARLAYDADRTLDLTTRIDELEAELAAGGSDPAAETAGRPLVNAWALVAVVGASIAALFGIGLAVALSRRAPRLGGV